MDTEEREMLMWVFLNDETKGKGLKPVAATPCAEPL
jgi:hypothetical protein